MKALRDGINNKDEVRHSSAYINADPTKISAYDQALQNAENIINAAPQVELNKDKNSTSVNTCSTNSTSTRWCKSISFS